MRLFITPYPSDSNDEVRVSGETLIYNGEEIDLSAIPSPPGYAEPNATPFVGRIQRVNGALYVNLIVQYDATTRRELPAPKDDDQVFDIEDGALPEISAPDLVSDILEDEEQAT